VARFTRVCAHERPGATAVADDVLQPSRSDRVTMPRGAESVVADLHALLAAAAVPGPSVIVGHSLGGLFVRLYAATYPDDVLGLVQRDTPLPPMPPVVLAHGIPFGEPFPGWPGAEMEAIMLALQENLARLVPHARFAIVTESGPTIHRDHPELVIDAIREVVDAVHNPGTWAAPDAGTPAS
jgi:pimeloyl-ACP methyl ester carboxylesterase